MNRLVPALLVVATAGGAFAQEQFFDRLRGRRAEPTYGRNVDYDGRLVFVRLRYASNFGGFGFRRDAPWAHDYPTADTHLMKILKELSLVDARVDGSNILTLDDEALFHYPIAYMSEPGFWTLTDKEAEGLRGYLLKGGFVIFDDFRGPDWHNFEQQMRRVMPEGQLVLLDGSSPIFHSFFEIPSPPDFVPPYGGYPAMFYGLFEDNDPRKRLMAIANYNNDLGEYWEFSDTGWVPVDLSNEAYKFGVNYIVYGLTH